jgi:CheY-like chemotaxis protein
MEITRKNILLVDDEDCYRELLIEEIPRKTLVKLTDISTASSGAEAIRLLESGRTFDLIISDYLMPNGTGVEILKYLNKNENPTRLVLFTNSVDIEIPPYKENFLGVIDKFDLRSLIKTVQSCLQSEKVIKAS